MKTCQANKIQILCTTDEEKVINKPSVSIAAEWLTLISTTNANVSTITANKLKARGLDDKAFSEFLREYCLPTHPLGAYLILFAEGRDKRCLLPFHGCWPS